MSRTATISTLALASWMLVASAVAQTPTAAVAGGTVLHLTENAERAVPRDMLRADLAAEASDADPTKVQAEINRRMSAALSRIKSVPALSVESGGYSVYQERADKAPPRWRGSQSVAVTGKDFAALLALVGDLQAGGMVVRGLTPGLSPSAQQSVEDELTDIALARLKQRADRVAATLGTKVASYRDLQVGNAQGQRPPMRAMAMAAPAAAMPSPVVEPGEAVVTVTIDANIVLASRP